MSQLPQNIDNAIKSRGISTEVWSSLKNSIYPGAKDESILMAIDYCSARKLDVLKKPCHIVPMSIKNPQTGNYEWRDVIMPGIYEQRITAFRTGQMAGEDEPKFGDVVSIDGVNAPEWCKVTVYRFINGERCAFSHTEYFVEACARTKDGKINAMWTKRPRGQLTKCAEAGALRKAFPDELGGVITSDEVDFDETINLATNTGQQKNKVIETAAVELISNEQAKSIYQLIETTGASLEGFLARAAIPSIESLPANQYERIVNVIKQNYQRRLNMQKETQQQEQQEKLESVSEDF